MMKVGVRGRVREDGVIGSVKNQIFKLSHRRRCIYYFLMMLHLLYHPMAVLREYLVMKETWRYRYGTFLMDSFSYSCAF